MKRLKGYLDSYRKAKILDIATGQGTFLAMVASIYDDFSEMVGIDTSERAIEAVKKNFNDPRISVEKMDIYDMSYEEGYFDITCLSNSMHHLEDVDRAIMEMAKVTDDNGLIIFNEMRSDNDNDRKMTHTLLHHFWAEIDEMNGIVHRKTMKRDEILDVFEKHPSVEIIDSWELEFDEKQEIDDSAYEWLNKTIDSSLKRVENHEEYDRLYEEASLLKKRLSETGFESASQILVVLKKAG